MRAESDGPLQGLERYRAWRVSEPTTVCQWQGVGKLGFEQDHWHVAFYQRHHSRL